MMRMLFVMGFMVLMGGCSGDNLRQGLYDGFKVHNDLQASPSERIGKPDSPSYNQYQQLNK